MIGNIRKKAGVWRKWNREKRASLRRLMGLGQKDLQPEGVPIADKEVLLSYRPEVALYLSGLENVAYQGNMWLPVLEKLDARVVIVLREARIAKQLNPTRLPVVFLDTMRDLEALEASGVKTILYPGNPQKVVQAFRFFRLNHFFINHGESDKVVNQSKLLMAYDKLLVAGELAEKRLHEARLPVRPDQVVHVGRPQVELLLHRVNEFPRAVRTIFYAPTWEGFVEEANYSSVSEFGLVLLQQLAQMNDVQVLFKPHPYTGHNRKGPARDYLKKMLDFCRDTGVRVVGNQESIFECMNQSDVLICDISSVLNDYLHTWKPIILANAQGYSRERLDAEFPSTGAAYVLNDPAATPDLLCQIEREDPMVVDRQRACRLSLGEFPQGSLNRFNQVVLESLKRL